MVGEVVRHPDAEFERPDSAGRRTDRWLNELSDHYLRDIGIDRPEIPELVKREIAWNGLLDSGWQRSRQPRRR